MRRPRLLITLAFVAILVFAGCGGDEDTGSAQPATTTTAAPAATTTTVAATITTAGSITRAQARTIALRAAGGGRVTDIEQDDEDNRQVWKVKVRKGSTTRKVGIDQQTGRVLKIERDTDEEDPLGSTHPASLP
jgi:uncharacterized membrane protein YkoI